MQRNMMDSTPFFSTYKHKIMIKTQLAPEWWNWSLQLSIRATFRSSRRCVRGHSICVRLTGDNGTPPSLRANTTPRLSFTMLKK